MVMACLYNRQALLNLSPIGMQLVNKAFERSTDGSSQEILYLKWNAFFKIWKIIHISLKLIKRCIYTNDDPTVLTNVTATHSVHGDTCFSEDGIAYSETLSRKLTVECNRCFIFLLEMNTGVYHLSLKPASLPLPSWSPAGQLQSR